MLIKFILPRLPSTKANKYPSYKIFGAGLDHNRYPKGYKAPSQELIDAARAIVRNKDFIVFLKDYRKKYDIPSKGYTYGKYLELLQQYEPLKTRNPFLKLKWELLVIFRKKYHVTSSLYSHLATLVIGNFIKVNKHPIEIDYPVKGYETTDGITIQINSSMTFKELVTFLSLKKQKKALEKHLKLLPKTQFKISKEQISISPLRKRKNTYKDAIKKGKKKKNLRKYLADVKPDAFRKRIATSKELVNSLFSYKPVSQ